MTIQEKGLGGYKWRLVAFLFVAFFIAQGARQLYNAALPQICIEFGRMGVTDAQLGAVGSVFGAVFGLAVVVAGIAADFLGHKRVLVAGTVVFSLGIFCCGFAGGVGAMIAFYGVVASLGQTCVAPSCYALILRHHSETRSTAMAIFQSAVYFGVILSSLFGGLLAEQGDGAWRCAFLAMGAIGFVWAAVMQFAVRAEPQREGTDGDKASVKEAFMAVAKKPTAILIAVAFGFFMYSILGIRLWAPTFLARTFEGVGTAKAALHGVLWMYIGTLVSCIATAKAIDKFGKGRPRIRLDVSVAGFLLCIAPVVWVAKAESFASCCAALGVLGCAIGVYEAAHYPAMFDCIAPRYRSAATGVTGCMAFLMGSLAPAVLGWMNVHMSMRAGIMSLAAFFLAGAVVLVPAQIWFFRKDWIGNEKA